MHLVNDPCVIKQMNSLNLRKAPLLPDEISAIATETASK